VGPIFLLAYHKDRNVSEADSESQAGIKIKYCPFCGADLAAGLPAAPT
jgi:hypothetical protein